MSELSRADAIRERLSHLELTPVFSRDQRPSKRLLLALALYAALLAVPLLWARTAADIAVGMTARADLVSRVAFDWQPSAADNHPVFHEIILDEWTENVVSSLEQLLYLARNADADDLVKRVSPLIKINRDTADSIRDYAASPALRQDLLEPLRAVLARRFYRHGVIRADDYDHIKKREILRIFNQHGEPERDVLLNADEMPLIAGQLAPDLRKAFGDYLTAVPPEARPALVEVLTQILARNPTLIYDAALTRAADRNARAHTRVAADRLLVVRGQRLSRDDFGKIVAERQAWRATQKLWRRAAEAAAVVALVFLLVLTYTHLFYHRVGNYHRAHRLFGAGVIALLVTVIACVEMHSGVTLHLTPIGVLAGFIALSCGAGAGTLSVMFFCLLLIAAGTRQFEALAMFMAGGAAFALRLPPQRFRMGMTKNALFSAFIGIATGWLYTFSVGAVAVKFSGWEDWLDAGLILTRGAWAAASWLVSLVIILLLLRFAKRLFGVTNNIILQDYQEHPLLNKLKAFAPGTYSHCSVVSVLAEAGARAVGANETLCRIACMYHDIGKLMKPQYFSENEQGFSRHDTLSPYMSNVIIISHVKDGVEMARLHNLPPEIIDVIAQHHGTTNTEFFLRRAEEERAAQEKMRIEMKIDGPAAAAVERWLFRYPGPRPQTIEAAIIMVADSLEAASRSLGKPSPARLRELVQKIAYGKMQNEQLDESGLTFAELRRAMDAMTSLLISTTHSRVSYDKKK
ncbi:MAG: HDIG domain-containing protein [Planctomycetota bacterium]|jgi:putative nucleotidyltransferase with HDIG domain|nr:HDIG domain-containing protein [Planctomycetota bacterium]